VNALCNLSRKKSREVAASLPGRFLSRRCFTLCITMEVEPRIANQYKCHHCCGYKNYRGKGMEGGKKVSFSSFSFFNYQKIAISWRKCVLGHPIARATCYCLLPDIISLRASKNVFQVGSVKFANSLSPPSIAKKVRTGSKSSKGLKRCRAKVKGVNNPPEPPNSQLQHCMHHEHHSANTITNSNNNDNNSSIRSDGFDKLSRASSLRRFELM